MTAPDLSRLTPEQLRAFASQLLARVAEQDQTIHAPDQPTRRYR